MHAATPRIGIQTTIFSKHEVLEDCCHLILPFRYFGKKILFTYFFKFYFY